MIPTSLVRLVLLAKLIFGVTVKESTKCVHLYTLSILYFSTTVSSHVSFRTECQELMHYFFCSQKYCTHIQHWENFYCPQELTQ